MNSLHSIRMYGLVLALFAAAFTWGCGEDTQEEQVAVLAAGTMFTVTLDQPLSTRLEEEGDEFEATLAKAVVVAGDEALVAGTKLRGEVAASRSGDEEGGPLLTIAFQGIVDGAGETHRIETSPIAIDASHAPALDDEMPSGSVLDENDPMVTDPVEPRTEDPMADPLTGSPMVEEIELPAGHELRVQIARPLEMVVANFARPGTSRSNY